MRKLLNRRNSVYILGILLFLTISCQKRSDDQIVSDDLHMAHVFRTDRNMTLLGVKRKVKIAYLDSIALNTTNKNARFLAQLIKSKYAYRLSSKKGLSHFDSLMDTREYKSHHPYIKSQINLGHYYYLKRLRTDHQKEIDLLVGAVSYLEPYGDLYSYELAYFYELIAHQIFFYFGSETRRNEWRNKAIALIKKYNLYPTGSIAIYNKYYIMIEEGNIVGAQEGVLDVLSHIPNQEELGRSTTRFYELLRKTYLAQNKIQLAQDVEEKIRGWRERNSVSKSWYYDYLKKVFIYEIERLHRFDDVFKRFEDIKSHYETKQSGGRSLYQINQAMVHYAKEIGDVQLQRKHLQNIINLLDQNSKKKIYLVGDGLSKADYDKIKQHLVTYDSILVHENKGYQHEKLLRRIISLDSVRLRTVENQSEVYNKQLDFLSLKEIEQAHMNAQREKEKANLFRMLLLVSIVLASIFTYLLWKVMKSRKIIGRQKTELDIVTNTVPIGMCKVDNDLNILWANRYIKNLYTSQFLENGPLNYKDLIDPSIFSFVQNKLNANPDEDIITLEGATTQELVAVPEFEEGHKWLTMVFVALRNEKGDKTGYILLNEDRTHEKLAEFSLTKQKAQLSDTVDELKKTNAKLSREIVKRKKVTKELRESQKELKTTLKQVRELSKMKSRFVSMASHEFRTPLTSILSSTSLLGRYTETKHQQQREKHLGRIRTSVESLIALLNDFLSVDRIEEGKLVLEPEKFNVTHLARETLEEMEGLVKEGQTIQLNTLGTNATVTLDKKMVKNIMLNLLSNASKYSGENQPIICKMELLPERILLTVKDQGIGIPEAEQDMLFQRFFRAKNVTNVQGTGLGLSIIKSYIELMQGEIAYAGGENKDLPLL